MRLMLTATLAALATLAVPCLAPPASAQASAGAAAEDLEVVTNFFMPGAPLLQALHETCSTAYRAKLSGNPADLAVERELPGVHDEMVAAASAYCDAEGATTIARWHNGIKADWRAATRPADLHRLAALFAPSVREAQAAQLKRGAAREQEDRLHAAQIAFAKTPGGAALVNQVLEYQAGMQRKLKDQQGIFADIVRGGVAASRRAANAYARGKGSAEPYPGS